MKVLYCIECDSIVRLTTKKRVCECWKCWGVYTGELSAVYFGKPILLGIDNNSFRPRVFWDLKENIYYNTRHWLSFDSSDIKMFTFWRSNCFSWKCADSMSKISKREFDNTKYEK